MSVVIGEEYKNWSWSKGALPFYLCNDCCCKNLSYHDHIQQSLVSGAGVDDHKWNHRGLQAIRDYGITNAGRFNADHNLDTVSMDWSRFENLKHQVQGFIFWCGILLKGQQPAAAAEPHSFFSFKDFLEVLTSKSPARSRSEGAWMHICQSFVQTLSNDLFLKIFGPDWVTLYICTWQCNIWHNHLSVVSLYVVEESQ